MSAFKYNNPLIRIPIRNAGLFRNLKNAGS